MDERMALKGSNYNRTSLRAPLSTFLLFENQAKVGKAKLVNISEGGFLLEKISFLPEGDEFPFLIDIPFLPALQQFALEDLFNFSIQNLKRIILRGKAKVVRKMQTPEGKEQLGCQFMLDHLALEQQEKFKTPITSYVMLTTSNLAHLLHLFEITTGEKERIVRLREIARILGYSHQEKIFLLHQKVMHDYQSLKWL